jgi:predicted ATPase
MTDPLPLQSIRVCNFKAIRDSGTVALTPLTAFIGNNGVGKSSLVEALETLQTIATDGLNAAMQAWHGFEYIWNCAAPHLAEPPALLAPNPMSWEIEGTIRDHRAANGRTRSFQASTYITKNDSTGNLLFEREKWEERGSDESQSRSVIRTLDGVTDTPAMDGRPLRLRVAPDESVLSAEPLVSAWQFLRLDPHVMMDPKPLRRTAGAFPLAKDGSNIAEYLLRFPQGERGDAALRGIVETLQAILPYAADLAPQRTSELEQSAYLQLTERGFRLPGWLLSTGTLRLVALLALFRHPEPPPVIVIEEIENGLDPRTIGLIVEEIRELVRSGRSQVILTTHSPYLLDLLPLESLVLVQRADDQPVFVRPADDESVRRWSKEFAPGRLYTMGRMRAHK